MLDFKVNYPDSYSNLWIVGVADKEVLAIEMQKGFTAPHLHLKSHARMYKMQIPLLEVQRCAMNR